MHSPMEDDFFLDVVREEDDAGTLSLPAQHTEFAEEPFVEERVHDIESTLALDHLGVLAEDKDAELDHHFSDVDLFSHFQQNHGSDSSLIPGLTNSNTLDTFVGHLEVAEIESPALGRYLDSPIQWSRCSSAIDFVVPSKWESPQKCREKKIPCRKVMINFAANPSKLKRLREGTRKIACSVSPFPKDFQPLDANTGQAMSRINWSLKKAAETVGRSLKRCDSSPEVLFPYEKEGVGGKVLWTSAENVRVSPYTKTRSPQKLSSSFNGNVAIIDGREGPFHSPSTKQESSHNVQREEIMKEEQEELSCGSSAISPGGIRLLYPSSPCGVFSRFGWSNSPAKPTTTSAGQNQNACTRISPRLQTSDVKRSLSRHFRLSRNSTIFVELPQRPKSALPALGTGTKM